jgi:hypothetical protein
MHRQIDDGIVRNDVVAITVQPEGDDDEQDDPLIEDGKCNYEFQAD